MTLNYPQDPCTDIDNSYRDNNVFKRSVLRILCKLVPSVNTILGKVGLIDAAGADITAANPLPVTGSVTVSSLPPIVIPAPSGSATAANQLLEIAELTSIDGKITTCNTGAVIVSNAGAGAAVNIQDGGNTITVDGSVVVSSIPAVSPAVWSLRYDEGATYTYIGEAVTGSLTANAVWRIKRLTNADNTIIWADGDSNLDNVWDNRAILLYS